METIKIDRDIRVCIQKIDQLNIRQPVKRKQMFSMSTQDITDLTKREDDGRKDGLPGWESHVGLMLFLGGHRGGQIDCRVARYTGVKRGSWVATGTVGDNISPFRIGIRTLGSMVRLGGGQGSLGR